MIQFDKDHNVLDIIDAVNGCLKAYGLEFRGARPSNDESIAYELGFTSALEDDDLCEAAKRLLVEADRARHGNPGGLDAAYANLQQALVRYRS